jgi:hypothetical protein
MPLSEYIAVSTSENPRSYYAGGINLRFLPPLSEDTSIAPFLALFEPPQERIVRFSLGKRNAREPHYDVSHKMIIQIRGKIGGIVHPDRAETPLPNGC